MVTIQMRTLLEIAAMGASENDQVEASLDELTEKMISTVPRCLFAFMDATRSLDDFREFLSQHDEAVLMAMSASAVAMSRSIERVLSRQAEDSTGVFAKVCSRCGGLFAEHSFSADVPACKDGGKFTI